MATEKVVGFGDTPTFTISKSAPAPKPPVSKTVAKSTSAPKSQESEQIISKPKPITVTPPAPKPAPSPKPTIQDIEGVVTPKGQILTTKGKPVSEKKKEEALKAAEGDRPSRRQRIRQEREGKRLPPQPTEKEQEAAFKEALRGFVAGEITAASLRREDPSRPGTVAVQLKPAETTSKAQGRKRLDAVFRELERRQITRERRAKLPTAARAILTLNETQTDVIQAVEKIRGGELDQKLSNRTEKDLRGAAASELKRVLPRSQYVEFLADAGWDDIFLNETKAGNGAVSDRAVEQWIRRRAARDEQLALAGVRAGFVPLFSVQLPIKALQAAKATSRTKRGVRQKFVDLIKSERGEIGVSQKEVDALKRGSRRGRITKVDPETARKLTQLKERVDEAQKAIPGKFDPATFAPFRKLAFEVADDPAKIVRRQRSLRSLVEKERPGAAKEAARKLARRAVPEEIDDLTQLRDVVGKAVKATPVKKGALRVAPSKPITEIKPGTILAPTGEPVVEAVGVPLRVADPGKAPARVAAPGEKAVPLPKTKTKALPTTTPGTKPATTAKPATQAEPGVSPAAQPRPKPAPKPGEKPAPRPAPQPKPTPKPEPAPEKALTPQPEKAVPQAVKVPPKAPPKVPPKTLPVRVPVIPFKPDIDFKVKGRKLPKGQFPRIVEWKQGVVVFRKDLVSGQLTTRGTKQSGRPRDTLRVITTSKQRPRTQVEKLGVVNLVVTAVGLDFVAAKRLSVGKAKRGFGRRRRM